eukprot:scaffold169606_cov53-Prasinocladus_malaysianus.AAC.1
MKGTYKRIGTGPLTYEYKVFEALSMKHTKPVARHKQSLIPLYSNYTTLLVKLEAAASEIGLAAPAAQSCQIVMNVIVE